MIDSNDTNEIDTNCSIEMVRDDKFENLDQNTEYITPDLIKLKRKFVTIEFILL